MEQVEAHISRDGDAGLPRRHEPDLGGLATFTLDPDGRITTWSVTAIRLFGPVQAGEHVGDVLLTGPGHWQLVSHALAETAAGRIWSATVAAAGWARAGSRSAGSRWPASAAGRS